MSATKLRNLAIATAVVVAGAFFAVRGRKAGPEIPAPGPAIPGLKDNLNNVTTLTILKPSGSVTLTRSGNGAQSTWVVPAKGGYPADVDRVRNVLIQLSNLELTEPQTSNPENYAKLGVQDVLADPKGVATDTPPKAPPSVGGLVEVKDGAGKTLGAIIIGNASSLGSATLDRPMETGQFVRKPGSPQSWLARGNMYLDADPMNWVDRKIAGLPRERVKSVSIRRLANAGPASPEGHGEPDLFISRKDKDTPGFEATGLPADAKLKPNEAVDGSVQTIAYLGMDDVIKDPGGVIGGSDPAAGPDGAHPAVAQFETFDGLALTVKTGFREGKWWAQVSADAAADALKPAANQESNAPDAGKEAAEINRKLGGWLFAISQFDAKRLSSSLKEMIAPPEVEQTPPAIGPAMPGATTSPEQGTPLPPKPSSPEFPAPLPK